MRAYSFSGREMLLDNARKDYLASGLWFWPFGFAWILSSGHACHTNRTILVSPSITNSAIFPQLLAAFGLDALKRGGWIGSRLGVFAATVEISRFNWWQFISFRADTGWVSENAPAYGDLDHPSGGGL